MKLALVCTPLSSGHNDLLKLYNPDSFNVFHVESLSQASASIRDYELEYGPFDIIIFVDTAVFLRVGCDCIIPRYNEVISTKNKIIHGVGQSLSYRLFICDSLTFHKLSNFSRFEKLNYFKDTYIENQFDKKRLFYFYAYRLGIKKIENSKLVTRK